MGYIGFIGWVIICGIAASALYLFCKPVRNFIKSGGHQND